MPFLRAGYSALAIATHEARRLERSAIGQTYPDKDGNLTPYTVVRITCQLMLQRVELDEHGNLTYTDIGGVNGYPAAWTQAVKEGNWLLIAHDFQYFVKQPAQYRALLEALNTIRATDSRILIVAPSWSAMPDELAKAVRVDKMPLPTSTELKSSLATVLTSVGQELDSEMEGLVLTAARGLTLQEAEDAFALAVVREGIIVPSVVANVKMDMIRSTGYMEYWEAFAANQFGGYSRGTDYITQKVLPCLNHPKLMKRGVACVGIAGCLQGDTPIYDPMDQTTKTVAKRTQEGKVFHVIAMDQYRNIPVITQALPPVNYGPEKMLEFTLENGVQITVTPGHRFWNGTTDVYAYEVAEQLQQSGPYLLPTIGDNARLARAVSVLHLTGTTPDSQDYYVEYLHDGDGEQPLLVEDIALTVAPSPDDAPVHTPDCLLLDDRDTRSGHNLTYRLSGHLSTQDYVPRPDAEVEKGCPNPAELHIPDAVTFPSVGRQSSGISHFDRVQRLLASVPLSSVVHSYNPTALASPSHTLDGAEDNALRCVVISPTAQQSEHEIDPDSKEGTPVSEPLSATSSASQHLRYTDTEYIRIVSVRQVADADYYDIHVPLYHNYMAQGIFHHNCGKSLMARIASGLMGWPLIRVDVGRIMGGVVGASEGNMAHMLDMVDAIAPCILLIDEFEKMFGGMRSSAQTDGGTLARMGGNFLTWMQEHKSQVLVFATINDFDKLDPEMIRSGRFNKTLYFGLPSDQERAEIAAVQLKKYDVPVSDARIQTIVKVSEGWTGAEIEALVQEAASRDPKADVVILKEEALGISPLSRTKGETIKMMEDYAKQNFYAANTPNSAAVTTVRRKIQSSN